MQVVPTQSVVPQRIRKDLEQSAVVPEQQSKIEENKARLLALAAEMEPTSVR